MTAIAFVADPHLGNHKQCSGPMLAGINRRCLHALNTLRLAARTAASATAFVVLGDLFDNDHPSPQIIAEAQRILPPNTIILKGNHDSSSDVEGDHALGPLSPIVQVVDTPRVLHLQSADLICVPFMPGNSADWLPVVLAELANGFESTTRVLALHLGIMSAKTASFLRSSPDAIDEQVLLRLLVDYGIQACFAGNWHSHEQWNYPNTNIVQVGTLCPTGWDNAGLEGYGRCVVLATTKIGQIGLPYRVQEVPGPRFLIDAEGAVISEEQLAALVGAGHHVYLRHHCSRHTYAEKQIILSALRDSGLIADFKIVLNVDAESSAQLRTAAQAAKSADTIAQGLADFVNTIPMPSGVEPAEVLALAQKYIASKGST